MDFEAILKAFTNLTGLPPPAFFAIIAVLLTIIQAYLRLPRQPSQPKKVGRKSPPKKSEPVGDLTPEELATFNGTDPSKQLLIAIKGEIYDVTRGRDFYGPGGAYGAFAGKDASRALAKMSVDPKDVSPDISGLSMAEKEALEGWELTFKSKYDIVGKVVPKKGDSGEEEKTTIAS